jgi:hypothetical protein
MVIKKCVNNADEFQINFLKHVGECKKIGACKKCW